MSQTFKTLFALTVIIALAGCQGGEIISRNPKSRAAGMRDFNDGNYADAAGSFRDAIRSDPRDYKSQFYLAQCYENLKQYQQAVQAYKASLDAQPLSLAGKEDVAGRIKTTEALAQCISKSDNRDGEINALEASAKANNSARDWMLLAMIYRNRGDADSALDAFNRAFLITPKDFVITKQYGLYLEQVGQKQKATFTLKKAYALNQTDEQVNDALRRLNVVPGPALKDEAALVKPPLPEGPLPEVEWSKLGQRQQPQAQGQTASDQQQPTIQQQPAPVPVAPVAPTATNVPVPGERAISGPRD
jgi:Tfp pilus assembly protein PilF